MNSISEAEKQGLTHFLESCGKEIVTSLAKIITNNLAHPRSKQEALTIILQHIPNAEYVLSKKCITRDILFNYMHQNQITIGQDFSKKTLIQKLLYFWEQQIQNATTALSRRFSGNGSEGYNEDRAIVECNPYTSLNFPIEEFAKQYCQWFFKKLNEHQLSTEDFWPDVYLNMQIVSGNCEIQKSANTDHSCVGEIVNTIVEQNLYFNVNYDEGGIQGKMEGHGILLIAAQGTLHIAENCVGIFESISGLMRSPNSNNNWKIKRLNMSLRNNRQLT